MTMPFILHASVLRKCLPVSLGRVLVVSGRGWRMLKKAVVETPRTSEGRVDYDRVPVGASIWVTVTDEASPLHGRPILITKLPDERFALTGGAGFEKWGREAGGKEEERETALRARKHLVLPGRKVRGTAADTAREAERQEILAHNEPLRRRIEEIKQAARAKKAEAQKKFEEATGVTGSMEKGALRQMRERIRTAVEEEYGLSGKEAEAFAAEVTRQMRQGQTRMARLLSARRARAAMRVEEFSDESPIGEGGMAGALHQDELKADLGGEVAVSWDWAGAAGELKDRLEAAGGELDTPEIQHLVAAAGEKAFGHAMEQLETHGADTASWEAGEGISTGAEEGKTSTAIEVAKPLDVKDPEAMTGAIEAFRALAGAQAEMRETRKALLPENIERVTPSALEQFRIDVELPSDEDVDRLMRAYEHDVATRAAPDQFYTALQEHWNDRVSYAEGVGAHVAAGATTALTGLVGEHLGQRVEVGTLVDKVGVEAATYALALDIRKRYQGQREKLEGVLRNMEKRAAVGQAETEKTALALHERLKKEEDTIRAAEEAGELSGRRVTEMMADALLRQRQNLGAALGSMQATAAMVEAMRRGLAAKTDVVTINFGDDQGAAEERFKDLHLSARSGEITLDPEAGWQIRTTAGALRRGINFHVQKIHRNGEWERLKTDSSPTTGFHVPMWGETFIDDEGNTQPYEWRTEQRNDIQWLRKAGSGVITRVTGAGKTNTCLGYYAHLLDESPEFMGVVVVPPGRVDQWMRESQRFAPELSRHVVAINEAASADEVRSTLAGVPRGAIVICSHTQATRYSEHLEALDPNAITLDEPQEMVSRASRDSKMTAGAKRVMRIKTDHRVALTATPARREPVDAYDLVHWAFPGEIGYRTRFARAFKGFGYGTNAQDEAVQNLLWREIAPYLSGDRLTPPSFKVNHEAVTVQRTPEQRQRQVMLEARAEDFTRDFVARELERVPDSEKTRLGGAWKSVYAKKAKARAMQELERMQRDVLRGERGRHGATAKIQAAVQRIMAAPEGQKHVIYVDSATQRGAVTDALRAAGMGRSDIINIAAAATTTSMTGADVARRKREFTEGAARIILIDRSSAAGHNLQAGSNLHVLGTPEDAATYLQAQGRVAREPRRGDVNILTYTHDDSPYEASDWARLHTQIKTARATSPGLFVSPEELVRRGVFLEIRPGARLRKAVYRATWDRRAGRVVVRLPSGGRRALCRS